MVDQSEIERYQPPRILLFSQRNIEKVHFRCSLYEFEDIICQVDSTDLLAPKPNKWFVRGSRLAQRVATRSRFVINPGIQKIDLKNKYDLFFAILQYPKDLINVKAVEGWRDQCKTAMCWINEIWLCDIDIESTYLKMLSKFDYVILNHTHSVDAVKEVSRTQCSFLPPGVDSILFCPFPEQAERAIDVYSVGRRSLETHETLLRMAKDENIFYVYDTINGQNVYDPREHRLLYANMAKRSRYFFAYPGKINQPGETNMQSEIGYRYFEGAAAGTIMIGEKPKTDEFAKYFDWSDAIIELPFGSKNISEVIKSLDMQPNRQETIRKNNVLKSLMKHDWMYRWQAVLELAGLDPMPQLKERKMRLYELASMVKT